MNGNALADRLTRNGAEQELGDGDPYGRGNQALAAYNISVT